MKINTSDLILFTDSINAGRLNLTRPEDITSAAMVLGIGGSFEVRSKSVRDAAVAAVAAGKGELRGTSFLTSGRVAADKARAEDRTATSKAAALELAAAVKAAKFTAIREAAKSARKARKAVNATPDTTTPDTTPVSAQ